MKTTLIIAIAAATFLVAGSPSYADDAHHPESASTTAKAPPKAAAKPAPKPAPKESKDQMARMDAQMKAMRDMHEKMVNAKTPADRQALKDEHMRTMREGMSMMNGMMGKQSAGKSSQSPEMMQKQMDMMQMMTEMMKDRMGAQGPAR